MKVYLAKKNGGVVFHTSLEALKELDGIDTPDMEITDAEFEAAGGRARLINGEIFLGKTPAEITAEENEKRVAEIDTALFEIDRKSLRPERSVSAALARGEAAPPDDVSRLDEYERQAAALREERALAVNQGA